MLPAMIEPMFAELGISPYLGGGAVLALLMLISRRSGRSTGQRSSD